MPLNPPVLNLRTQHETVAFRCIDKIIRSDPVLAGVFGRHIYSWTGDALDDAEPAPNQLPWLRLTPSPGSSDWENEGQHSMPMIVGIELAVAGTNANNLMNLWGAVRDALFPSDPADRESVLTQTQAAGITQGTLARPAYGAKKLSDGAKALAGAGELVLTLLIDT